MAASRQKPPADRRIPPKGPFGHLLRDALEPRNGRGRLSYADAVERINRIAKLRDSKAAGYSTATIRNWIGRSVIPSHLTLGWIAEALEIPLQDVIDAAATSENERYKLRHGQADDGRTAVPSLESAEPAAQLVKPSIILTQPLTVLHPDEALPYPLTEDTYPMMRRQFLQQLLSVTAAALSPSVPSYVRRNGPSAAVNPTVFLQECESNIRACWRLMHGRDMIVVPSVLSSWLPLLDSLLRDSSPHRRELAALAAEGYMLGGLVTVLQGHIDRAEWFCQQAVDYAVMSGHPDLKVAALKHLATKYLDAQYPILTLRTYERAAQHLDSASPLSRGRTYLGLALAYAQVGNHTDAQKHLGLAHDNFPDHPDRDPAFAYTDARRASLHHYGGLIHLIAGRPRQAWDTWAEAVHDPDATRLPERTLIEIINCQAEAAIALGDVELASSHIEASVQGARSLRSPKRYADSLDLYRRVRRRWPASPHVKHLEAVLAPDDLPQTQQ